MSMNHCTALQLAGNRNINIPEDESCWQVSIQSQLPDNPDELTKLIVVCKSQMDALQNCVQHLETADELNDTYLKLQTEYRYISEAVIRAEIKLGKFIDQIPKATSQNNLSGKSKSKSQNVSTDDLGYQVPSKKEQVKKLGVTSRQAENFQRMFKHQKIVEQVIEEYRLAKKIINRSCVLKKIKQYQAKKNQQPYNNHESPQIVEGNIADCTIEQNFQMIITAPPSLDSKFFVSPKEWLLKVLNSMTNKGSVYIFVDDSPTELRTYLEAKLPNEIIVLKLKDSVSSSEKLYQHSHKFCFFYQCDKDMKLNSGNNRNAIQTVTSLTQAAEIFIQQVTKKNDVVFDPFAGKGDLLLTATKLGRKAYGLEQDKNNIKIACENGCESLSLLNEESDLK